MRRRINPFCDIIAAFILPEKSSQEQGRQLRHRVGSEPNKHRTIGRIMGSLLDAQTGVNRRAE